MDGVVFDSYDDVPTLNIQNTLVQMIREKNMPGVDVNKLFVAACETRNQLGDQVQVRDLGGQWEEGIIKQFRPLKVQAIWSTKPREWDEVRGGCRSYS